MRAGLTGLVLAAMACGAAGADPALGIAGTLPASGDYGEVLAALQHVGAEATSLTLFWDDFDQAGTYAPDVDWPAIANTVYPDQGIALTLTIPVIDTVADRRPEDLRDLPWDDPIVAHRFATFIDAVLDRMPDITLLSLAIGNEVDGLLSGVDVYPYARFFDTARAHVRARHPDLPVSITVTRGGMMASDDIFWLAALGDVWTINWYPLTSDFHVQPADSFAETLDTILNLPGDNPIHISEGGVPSDGCNGSPEIQAQFIETLMSVTDPRLERVMLVWMHDIPATEVESYQAYYGVDDPCFARYIASLGLRTHAGVDKPAFTYLRNR